LVNPGLLDDTHDGEIGSELDEEELEVLREAGIISESSQKGRMKNRTPKRIVFANNEGQDSGSSFASGNEDEVQMREPADLGWKIPCGNKKSKKGKLAQKSSKVSDAEKEIADGERRQEANRHRKQLLKELSARLVRDKQLRYAQREFEMQRFLMGKGARQKLSGAETIEPMDGDEEDEADAQKGKPQARTDPKLYKPRAYKWRIERKR
jgi:U3 small nucleolar RNA-associated protein 11